MEPIKIYDLEFVSKKHEFNSVYTFRFKPTEPLDFKAGQWGHLGFPLPNRDKSLVRHMSFASAPSDELLEFTMDISSASAYKQKLSELQQGDIVKAFKIVGNFQVSPEQTDDVVFICGGIGITPARSIIRQLKYEQSTVNWTLVHVSRDEFLYENELSIYNNKQIRISRGELEKTWLEIINKPSNTQYLISGSERFVEGIYERLTSSGIKQEQIVIESFH